MIRSSRIRAPDERVVRSLAAWHDLRGLAIYMLVLSVMARRRSKSTP